MSKLEMTRQSLQCSLLSVQPLSLSSLTSLEPRLVVSDRPFTTLSFVASYSLKANLNTACHMISNRIYASFQNTSVSLQLCYHSVDGLFLSIYLFIHLLN